MTTVDELRDALLDDMDRDGVVIIDHEGFVSRLDALIAAAEARGRAGLVEAVRGLVTAWSAQAEAARFASRGVQSVNPNRAGQAVGLANAAHDLDTALATLPAPEPSSGVAPVEERCAALEAALDELMTLRTEHGVNCYVTDDVGCTCGLDEALERITDARLGLTPAPRSAGAGDGRTDR